MLPASDHTEPYDWASGAPVTPFLLIALTAVALYLLHNAGSKDGSSDRAQARSGRTRALGSARRPDPARLRLDGSHWPARSTHLTGKIVPLDHSGIASGLACQCV